MDAREAVDPALAEQLRAISDAAGEASLLLTMNLEQRNLNEELLNRIRTIIEAAESARQSLVVKALASGLSVRETARCAGVGTSTVQRWKAEN
jgi:DNA-directed RNA polymerase specialized sigma24 family protein